MFGFIIKRLFAAIPLLLILSMISFFLIQVPPGDYADRLKSQAITMSGMSERDAQIVADKYRRITSYNVCYTKLLRKPVELMRLGWSTQ